MHVTTTSARGARCAGPTQKNEKGPAWFGFFSSPRLVSPFASSRASPALRLSWGCTALARGVSVSGRLPSGMLRRLGVLRIRRCVDPCSPLQDPRCRPLLLLCRLCSHSTTVAPRSCGSADSLRHWHMPQCACGVARSGKLWAFRARPVDSLLGLPLGPAGYQCRACFLFLRW